MPPRPLLRLALPALLGLLSACSPPPPQGAADARAADAQPAPAVPPASRAAAPGGPRADPCRDPGVGPEPDAAGLRSFVRRRAPQLRDCYQRALKRDAAVAGKATFRFTIGSCGELSDVEIAARRGRVDDAAACVRTAMRGWRTPFRPAEPVTVEYPVAFSASM